MRTKHILFVLIFFLFINSFCYAKVGLVLSGGGAKGLVHIGVLKELDKKKIKIDYIAGTSMGCIIGVLYSLGYDGETLERIIFESDIINILDDRPIRKYVPMYEKDESERYISSFSISSNRSFLPTGIVSGQKIYMLLSNLAWNYQTVKDFSKLPIPVSCVATDLANGDEIILDKGNIAQAMRTSMSIPTVFTPVDSKGRLLVDGGVVNNLPIDLVKKMGADFVIAVDVTGGLYKKEEIKSFFNVIEQVVSLQNYKNRERIKKQANVLIEVDTNDYSLASFDEIKPLVLKGEAAAKTHLTELDKLPKRGEYVEEEKETPKEFKIVSIKVEGLQKVTEAFVVNNIGFHLPEVVGKDDVETGVQKVYGTQFFESVFYDVVPLSNGDYELVLHVKERATSLLRFGINYSNYTKASLLLSTLFKNTFGTDSRVSLDLNLSENPAFKAQYYSYSQRKPGFGFKTEFLFNKFNITTYKNGAAQAVYRFSYYALSLNAETNFSNYMLLGLGVDKEFTTKVPSLLPAKDDTKQYDEYLTFHSYFKVDTLDSITYPKKGIKIDGDFKLVTDALSFQEGINHKPFEHISFNTKFALPVANRVSFITNASIGTNVGDDIPYEYLFYYGGFRSNDRWFLPFVGVDYMSVSGQNALVIGESMQIEMVKNIYFIFTANIGKFADQFRDVFNERGHLFGLAATLGWDSRILGPVEVTLMKELSKNAFIGNISIGYWF